MVTVMDHSPVCVKADTEGPCVLKMQTYVDIKLHANMELLVLTQDWTPIVVTVCRAIREPTVRKISTSVNQNHARMVGDAM